MNSKALQYHLRSSMFYGQKYTSASMLLLYNEIMNRGPYCTHKKLAAKTVTNRLNEWSTVDGGWLIKEGSGNDAVYFKRPPAHIGILEYLCQMANKVKSLILSWPGR